MGKQLLGLILDRGAAGKIALAGGREIFADARPTFSPILGREEEKKNPAKNPPPPPLLSPFGTNGQKRTKKRPSFLLFAFFRTLLFFFVAALKKIDGIVYPMGEEEKRVFFTCPLPAKDRHPPRAEEMSCLKTA